MMQLRLALVGGLLFTSFFSIIANRATGDAPVKVYIMAGQSNMIGYGRAAGNEPGTLETLVGDAQNPQYTHWGTPGNWNSRDDVWHSAIRSATDEQWLSIGGGVNDNSFGPELQFGHVMGEHHDEPVLLLKTAIGNRALGWDLLPPNSQRYDYNGFTYAGSGDTQERWPIGTEPNNPVNWYAGKEFDDYSTLALDRLTNFDAAYPHWEGRGYEIAGFVWFQGHRDGGQDGKAIRYETNMVNFIKEWRNVFDAPNAPFVLSTIGFGGQTGMTPNQEIIWQGQLNVDGDAGIHPEFLGNVNTTDARDDWFATGPSTQGFQLQSPS